MRRTLSPQFGIKDLDAMIQCPSASGLNPEDSDPYVLAIEGPVGSGKSTLALHLAAQFLQARPASTTPRIVILVSTDWRLSQALSVWQDFRLDKPPEVRQPYPSHTGFSPQTTPWISGRIVPVVVDGSTANDLALVDWMAGMQDCERSGVASGADALYFLDLSDTDVGDEWLLLERLLALIKRPKHGSGLIIVDSVPGMQTTSGERDAFGRPVPSDERIGRLIKAMARKCCLVFTTAALEAPEKTNRDEWQCDFIYRVEILGTEQDPQRYIRVVKARGCQHALGRHLLEVRSRAGYYSSSSLDPDNKPWDCEYLQVTPSITTLSDAIKRARLNPPTASPVLNGFGIRYLDTLLEERTPSPLLDGDGYGVRCGRIVAVSGEGGTHKSELAMAFARHTFADAARLILALLEACLGRRSALESYDSTSLDFWGATRSRWLRVLSPPDSEVKSGDDIELLRKFLATEGATVAADADPESSENQDWWKNLWRIVTERFAGGTDHAKSLGRFAIIVSSRYMEHKRITEDIALYLIHRYEHHIDILLTKITSPVRRSKWASFLRSGLFDLFRRIVADHLIYRRLSGRELSPAIAFNAIRRCVEHAVVCLGGHEALTEGWPAPLPDALQPRVRLVVDDLYSVTLEAARGEYHEFRSLLNTYLRTRLVTSVLVETNGPSGQAGQARSPFGRQEQEISIRTWRVRFESGDRVAIAVEPAEQPDAHGIVRELRLVPLRSSHFPAREIRVPLVDPDFELYANLPAGSPKLVPLEVRLYAETDAWVSYCEREEEFLRAVVRIPMPGESAEVTRIINRLPQSAYRLLQDLCTLPNSANLPSTVVLQVDGFWALQRNGDLRNLHSYLSRFVNVGLPHEQVLDDQFLTHRRILADERGENEGKRRYDRFTCKGIYESRISRSDRKSDRVPMMWDMGFLLIDDNAWEFAKTRAIEGAGTVNVNDVRTELPGIPTDALKSSEVSTQCDWRLFLGACVEVAKAEEQRTGKKVVPLGLSSPMPDSVDCLVLEMWLSECVGACRAIGWPASAAQLLARLSAAKFEEPAASGDRHSLLPLRHGLLDLLGEIDIQTGKCDRSRLKSISIRKAFSDFRNLRPAERKLEDIFRSAGFALQLYQTWLLLLEAFSASSSTTATDGNPGPPPHAVAVRHWYKTACAAATITEGASGVGAGWIPKALPGYLITRGDWYLGIAKGSRSVRLGELALDALTDDMSNRQRLDLGIGLPVTQLVDNPDACGRIPTALKVRRPYGWDSVTLAQLRSLGGQSYGPNIDEEALKPGARYWLWRSEIGGYDWQSRPFRRWLRQLLDWSAKYRFKHQGDWDGGGGFRGYDDIRKGIMNPGTADSFEVVCGYDSLVEFGQLCDDLRAELISVTPFS